MMGDPKIQLWLEIEGFHSDIFTCSLPTKICLFVLDFCKAYDIVTVFLLRIRQCFRICSCPISCLDNASYEVIDSQQLPPSHHHCDMPISMETSGSVIHSGLCSVLRHLVISSTRLKPDVHLDILGYRQMCLKACAEVSAWTKFCEISMVLMTTHFVERMRSCGFTSLTLPDELLKFEHHLTTPVKIANKNKRRRAAEKLSVNTPLGKHEMKLGNLEPVHNGLLVLDELPHSFAEGPDMTLTDLVLFVCINAIQDSIPVSITLFQHLPHVHKWFLRMASLPSVLSFTQKYGLHVTMPVERIVEAGQPLEVHLPDPLPDNLNIRETKPRSTVKSFGDTTQFLKELQKREIVCNMTSHPYQDRIELQWQQFPQTVHPAEGGLPCQRIARKCQQLGNLVSVVMEIAKEGDVIVDFCAGGGHLGIVLAYLLPQCKIVLVENKEESISRAETRVSSAKLENVTLYQCNLDYFHGTFDIGVSLHACGVATDLVLQRCLDNMASFVICPCCYGAIRNTHTIQYPRSQYFKEKGLLYSEYQALAHTADKTEVNIKQKEHGNTCMSLIDTDRASLARGCGYSITLCHLVPPDCTPKNNLLIGSRKQLSVCRSIDKLHI